MRRLSGRRRRVVMLAGGVSAMSGMGLVIHRYFPTRWEWLWWVWMGVVVVLLVWVIVLLVRLNRADCG